MTTDDRLDELLTLEATQGLTPAEARELDALLAAHPDADPDALALAAAALHLALSAPPDPLPAHVAAKLHRAAAGFAPAPARPRPAYAAWAGWAVAACLAGVLVFTNWPKPPRPEPTLAQKRDELRTEAVTFAGAKGATTGGVVWCTAKQEGYLEVCGLPPLDPAKEQYQLWIVDPSKKQPVDGGVFDVNPDGTALVRVRNPIQVKDAKAFAVTKEVAGGVVVSDGPHLLVLTPKPG